jgi:hypothetical protein
MQGLKLDADQKFFTEKAPTCFFLTTL